MCIIYPFVLLLHTAKHQKFLLTFDNDYHRNMSMQISNKFSHVNRKSHQYGNKSKLGVVKNERKGKGVNVQEIPSTESIYHIRFNRYICSFVYLLLFCYFMKRTKSSSKNGILFWNTKCIINIY